MNRKQNAKPRRQPEAIPRIRPDERHLMIREIVHGLVEARRPRPARDLTPLRVEIASALREALNGTSPTPPIAEGWGVGTYVISSALKRAGFDLADPDAVEGWYATGLAALEAELAGVEAVAVGVGDDPYVRSLPSRLRRYRLRLSKLTPADFDRVLAEIFRVCPRLGPPTYTSILDIPPLASADIYAVVAALRVAGTGVVGRAVMALDEYDVGELVRLQPEAACGRLATTLVQLALEPDGRCVDYPGSRMHLVTMCINTWHSTRLTLTAPENDPPFDRAVAAELRREIAPQVRREFAESGLRRTSGPPWRRSWPAWTTRSSDSPRPIDMDFDHPSGAAICPGCWPRHLRLDRVRVDPRVEITEAVQSGIDAFAKITRSHSFGMDAGAPKSGVSGPRQGGRS